ARTRCQESTISSHRQWARIPLPTPNSSAAPPRITYHTVSGRGRIQDPSPRRDPQVKFCHLAITSTWDGQTYGQTCIWLAAEVRFIFERRTNAGSVRL